MAQRQKNVRGKTIKANQGCGDVIAKSKASPVHFLNGLLPPSGSSVPLTSRAAHTTFEGRSHAIFFCDGNPLDRALPAGLP
jgi:hypothetical protein